MKYFYITLHPILSLPLISLNFLKLYAVIPRNRISTERAMVEDGLDLN